MLHQKIKTTMTLKITNLLRYFHKILKFTNIREFLGNLKLRKICIFYLRCAVKHIQATKHETEPNI